MYKNLSLNGSDWRVTGWWKHQWRFTRSLELNHIFNAPVQTVPATVPGAIQLDLMKNGLLPDPNYGLDSNFGEWVNNREWFLDKEFTLPRDISGEKIMLCFDGLDYEGEIYLNGVKLTDFSGMFIPLQVDITAIVKREELNFLRVIFYQTPEVDGQFGYTSRIPRLKSRFNYIWDWCPRIVPVGIWKDVYLKIFDDVDIQDFYPRALVDPESHQGRVDIGLKLEAAVAGTYRLNVDIFYKGREICSERHEIGLLPTKQKINQEIHLGEVDLWWPHGQGEQPLYDIHVSIKTVEGELCGQVHKRVGFRDIRFEQNLGAPVDAIPYTLMVNDRRVFMRGVNWVPISPFYGAISREDYRRYLGRFKDMNCNLLRIWGGAILEHEAFYELCDELGLMVWQEFPQSSSGVDNTPPDDPDYLKELEEVAGVYIRARRHHASHIIWCGGNELMMSDHKPVDEGHINIGMLKGLVEQLDPGKCFLPTSASGPREWARENEFGKGVHHDVHGPWNYEGEPYHYHFFNGDDSLFRSETGCSGISRRETLEKYKGDFKLWPPDESNPYWMHRGAWWIQMKELTGLFGAWSEAELDGYIKSSRYLQGEALRYAIEATRRREPVSSGFIIWMGNEPFPNTANTSVIEYDGTPKPSYYWIRDVFSPLHVSLKYDKIHYASGERFHGEVYLTRDFEGEKEYTLRYQILDIEGGVVQEDRWMVRPEHPAQKVGDMEWEGSELKGQVFLVRLVLMDSDGVVDENDYLFTMDNDGHPLQPLRNLPPSKLIMEENRESGDGAWTVRNDSSTAAIGIFLYGKNPSDFFQVTPNYFNLMPGESRMVSIESDTRAAVKSDNLCVEIYNG